MFGATKPQTETSKPFNGFDGNSSSSHIFGTEAPKPVSSNLFGTEASTPASSNLFGTEAPKPASYNIFGTEASKPDATTPIFGTSNTSDPFGAAQKPSSSSFSFFNQKPPTTTTPPASSSSLFSTQTLTPNSTSLANMLPTNTNIQSSFQFTPLSFGGGQQATPPADKMHVPSFNMNAPVINFTSATSPSTGFVFS